MELQAVRWDRSVGWSGRLPKWDGPHTLVLAFGTSELIRAQGPLCELASAYPASAVVGCSTAGEIMGDTVFQDSLVVAIVRFRTTRITVVSERVDNPGRSYTVGMSLATRLIEREPALSSIFVLSDGLQINGSSLVAGLVEGTGGQVLITGGLAGDDEAFERTWTLVNGVARSGYVTAVGLAGPDIKVGHGSRGGWDIFGPERRVTRSEGNVLYELDGQPALKLYKNYLGERAVGLPATALLFPLAVRTVNSRTVPLVRTVVAVDERAQSMTFAGDIPRGSLAQLMRANLDRLIDGAHVAALDTMTLAGQPSLAIAVSCVGRRMVLGKQTEDEIDAARSGLPDSATLVGFYSYGEVSSNTAGRYDLNNQTMTITTLWESADVDEQ